MATMVIQLPKSVFRRRGMGAAPMVNSGTRIFGGVPRRVGTPASFGANLVNAPTATFSTTSPNFPRYGGGSDVRQGSQYGGGQNGQSHGGNWSGQSNSPSQADIQAFQQALAYASQLGVITPAQAAQYQDSANGATDQQLQTITATINQLVASTPSVAAAANAATVATAAATPATSTSWWSGTTTLLGSTVSNSTLAIGGAAAAFVAWLAFGRKK